MKHWLRRSPDRTTLEAELDAEMKQGIDSGFGYGMVMGVYKDCKSLIKGYGSVFRGSADVPTPSTVFEIASLTKLFTAATLQILCDAGMLRLDASLGEVMKGCALAPAARKVTLRQLAAHRGGFPSFPGDHLGRTADRIDISRDFTIDDMHAYLEKPVGMRRAGRFKYSSFGYGLLGHVLASSGGKSYEKIVGEALLNPLGMKNTAITLSGDRLKDLAQGYSKCGEAAELLDWSGGFFNGAGALKSTASDMLLFIKANLDDDSSPVSRSLRKTHVPQFHGKTALGWMRPTFRGRIMGNQGLLWHSGLTPGYASYIAIDTKTRTGLILLANRSADITFLGISLMRRIKTHSWSSS